MRPIATNAACSVVCVCVCVMVTRMCCAKPAEPIEMPFGSIQMSSRNHALDYVEIPTGMGNFGGYPTHWKALGVTVYVSSERDHSVLNNATAAADCNAPHWSVSHYIVPCQKSAPPAMWPFGKTWETKKRKETHTELYRNSNTPFYMFVTFFDIFIGPRFS